MCQAVLNPNLTKKFQWEVSQIADDRFPCMMLLGGLSVNLNHLSVNLNHLKRGNSAPRMTSYPKKKKLERGQLNLMVGGCSMK